MSSDGEYMPDDEEADASSSVSSEGSSDFIASEDDESSESNDDVSYDQPELESEDDGCNTNQCSTPTRHRGKRRKCTSKTNEKMHQMLEDEELSDNEVFGSDTQDVSPSSKLGARPSSSQYVTPSTRSMKRRKCTKETNDKMSQMLDEEELSDDEVFGNSDYDTQDMNLGAPNFKEGVPSSEDEVDEQNHSSAKKKKKRKRIYDSDDDESDEESDDNIKGRVSILFYLSLFGKVFDGLFMEYMHFYALVLRIRLDLSFARFWVGGDVEGVG